MSLIRSAVSGVKWSSASQFGRQIMQFVTTAILARLLSPEDFGLLGMATVVSGFLFLFSDLGTSAAVVQKQDLSLNLVSSLFWVNVCFGLLVAVCICLLSPLVGYFYHEPNMVPILKVLAFSFVISSLGVMHQALLQRELKFELLAKVELVATATGAVIGIAAAIDGWGVWSLVSQTMTVAVVTVVLLWCWSGWRPTASFSLHEVKSVSKYSLNLVGFSIFNYIARNADYLLVGRYLGAQSLGYYSLAYRLMLYPLQSISGVIGRVMFPVYSQIKDDVVFRKAFLKVALAIAFVTFPMMTGLLALSRPFVSAVFGESWKPVALLLMILAPVGMLQSVGSTVGAIYQVKGRTDWMFRWGMASGALALIAFVIGLRWGIVGVASAYAVVSLLVLSYPSFSIPLRLIGLKVSELLITLWPAFLCSLIMLLCLMTLTLVLPKDLSSGLVLGIAVPTGVLVYASAIWFLNRSQLEELLSVLRAKQ